MAQRTVERDDALRDLVGRADEVRAARAAVASYEIRLGIGNPRSAEIFFMFWR
ncbi:hypothetical protein NKG05_24170 [Oerskovia sp. M15]